MRKLAVAVIVSLILALFFILRSNDDSTDVRNKVIVYDPPISIASLYKGNPAFDEIDFTQPEGVLFAKTRVKSTNQLDKIYCTEMRNEREIMDLARSQELSDSFKKEWGQNELIFSFYYSGIYGPPHWFGIADNPEGSYRVPLLLVLNDGSWCQYGDVGKYPIRIAFFDLCEKHDMFDKEKPLTQTDIEVLINDWRNIDDIISKGMEEDPEHYGPVLILD